MVTRKYIFNYYDYISFEYLGFGMVILKFQDIPEKDIDNVLEKISENIKHIIKEQYSLKIYRMSCFDKGSFFNRPPPPINLINFRKYEETPFNDDIVSLCSVNITVNPSFVKHCLNENRERFDIQ